MRVIICGGRDYILTDADRAWLDGLKDSLPIAEVVCGGATGADRGGEEWAKLRGLSITWFRAAWKEHSRAAGPIRNQQMADYADACIAFPGGKGTADMIRRAQEKGLRVIERQTALHTGATHDDI